MAKVKGHRPVISPETYLQYVVDTFTDAGDPLRAEQQRAYMRNQFEFCGLGAPQWMALAKDLFLSHGLYTGKPLEQFVGMCFEQEYREVHYAGIEMMQRMLAAQSSSWIRVLEKCITTQSWWDTVDWLSKLTGIHFKQYPELQEQYAHRWIESNNIWLQRVAIIHQLLWKEKTDEKLLFAMIRRRADSKEFFIQKGCGWALRQHAKIYPDAVMHFLDQQAVSKLTYREATKHMKS